MGCLNSGQGFGHWFANVHLSGPCNRRCYFCIGQHMMALDGFNSLDTWPMPGWSAFVEECKRHAVGVVYLTGTNTDPLLFRHIERFTAAVRNDIGSRVGIRTNGATRLDALAHFDTGSVTICSLSQAVHAAMMGRGAPADIKTALWWAREWSPALKVNIVLGPENVGSDLERTIEGLGAAGVQRVNLREPYGQPRVGDPFSGRERAGTAFGMPLYRLAGVEVLYWDVHFVEVESVNLYASGRVSTTYPITKGHADNGEVMSQDHFRGGRVREQWQSLAGAAL